MDLPGSSAFGVFTPAMFRTLLVMFKSWLEGGSNSGGGNPQGAGGDKKGQRSSKRGGKTQKDKDAMDEDEESEDEGESEEEDDDDDGGSRRRKLRSRRGGRRTAGASSSSSSASSVVPALEALQSCLSRGSLGSSLEGHEDLLTDMADLVLGALGSAASGTSTAEAAKSILLGMLNGKGDRRTVVLRALMPLLIMKPVAKPGLPTDARGRTAAHQKALQVRAGMT